jgi:hypothetical protein
MMVECCFFDVPERASFAFHQKSKIFIHQSIPSPRAVHDAFALDKAPA